jgi:hypothetical protein
VLFTAPTLSTPGNAAVALRQHSGKRSANIHPLPTTNQRRRAPTREAPVSYSHSQPLSTTLNYSKNFRVRVATIRAGKLGITACQLSDHGYSLLCKKAFGLIGGDSWSL